MAPLRGHYAVLSSPPVRSAAPASSGAVALVRRAAAARLPGRRRSGIPASTPAMVDPGPGAAGEPFSDGMVTPMVRARQGGARSVAVVVPSPYATLERTGLQDQRSGVVVVVSPPLCRDILRASGCPGARADPPATLAAVSAQPPSGRWFHPVAREVPSPWPSPLGAR